jgi:uncharacterized membrane-anchored protein
MYSFPTASIISMLTTLSNEPYHSYQRSNRISRLTVREGSKLREKATYLWDGPVVKKMDGDGSRESSLSDSFSSKGSLLYGESEGVDGASSRANSLSDKSESGSAGARGAV